MNNIDYDKLGEYIGNKATEYFNRWYSKDICDYKDEISNANEVYDEDLDMFIPHQANLRISQFVQQKMGLPDEKVFNNIQKYGNTTAASIPIALCEALDEGKVKKGDLVCLTAFGSGFTWGSVLFRY